MAPRGSPLNMLPCRVAMGIAGTEVSKEAADMVCSSTMLTLSV